MRLLLYGTLLDPALLGRIAGHAVALTPATLDGWRRVAWRDRRYPTLRRGRGVVQGALVTRAGPAIMARLAAYEGRSWRLRPVLVRVGRRRLSAHAWVAPGGTLRGWP